MNIENITKLTGEGLRARLISLSYEDAALHNQFFTITPGLGCVYDVALRYAMGELEKVEDRAMTFAMTDEAIAKECTGIATIYAIKHVQKTQPVHVS